MARKPRTFHVVERGIRGPGGHIAWTIAVHASDWFYANEVAVRILREGHLVRRREVETVRPIPTSPEEAAWHAQRAGH